MSQGLARYPGAHPFDDTPTASALFFGRNREKAALANLILANRLVVLYAKSGVGKTSVLRAGVAGLLRDAGCVPLFVRLNDPGADPAASVLDQIAAEAQRQHVEYQPGSRVTLWHFFKTAEFWRDDQLLTPVLVLDQFEELFTLHTPEVRAGFLPAIGHVVRGVRPADPDGAARSVNEVVSANPPHVRLVLSLREDSLGTLEEGASAIPQILDHRFRLLPLPIEASAEALEGPAGFEDERLATRPFSFARGDAARIIDYLSRRTGSSTASQGGVEPFHLQLVCQKVEALVAARQQRDGRESQTVSLADLGGEEGLNATLRDFYEGVLRRIPHVPTRRRARRLCDQYLISPEGHRLSLDEREVRRLLRLDAGVLGTLVDQRLLRMDRRADSCYFELSHDCLIGPVRASRMIRTPWSSDSPSNSRG